jgi:hypothetical protein
MSGPQRWITFALSLAATWAFVSVAAASSCEQGKVSLVGHCCWPGQDWGLTTQRCIGTPECPSWTVPAGDDCTALFEPSPSPEYAGVVRADCSTTASNLPGELGARYLVACPDRCGGSTAWGTGVYTDDSSVCSAAIHNGIVTSEGGVFSLVLLPGRDAYRATQRHGVASSSWASWARSFAAVLSGVEETLWLAAERAEP